MESAFRFNSVVTEFETQIRQLTLKFNGRMLNTRITSNMDFFSSSAPWSRIPERRRGQLPNQYPGSQAPPFAGGRRVGSYLPIPKLGPPLYARLLHRFPCMTPARTSSKNT